LVALGAQSALVVSADDGLDELSISSRTRVIEVKEGGTEEWFVEPGQFGLEEAGLEKIAGGEPGENAEVIRSALGGAKGPARDVILLNAGAAIYVGGRADDLADGVEQAREAVESGAAARLLEQLIERSTALAG
jgi:anthranilate phosphoribosyltransferase